MGTPDFAVPTLAALIGQGHEIVAVYTRAPKPAGRGMAEQKTPVHRLAEGFGLPVFTPKSLRNDEAAALFASHGADVAVVVAYGLILPPAILAVPALGCLNLHGSLLPRWRGAAPLQRAVMAGDDKTGVMVMKMEEGLDTGPVAMTEPMIITAATTAQDVHDTLSQRGADLMVRALSALERGTLAFTPQPDEGVTYAAKIDKAESRIDWSRPAEALRAHVHGLSPFPGAWCEMDFGKGFERLKVLRCAVEDGSGVPGTALDDRLLIACGTKALRLLEVQRAGSKPLKAEEFLRGLAVPKGTMAR